MESYEQVMEIIKSMGSEDRYKLVKDVIKFTEDPEENESEFLIELLDEFMKVKQDVEYLSKTIGVHDLYLNRIKREIGEFNLSKGLFPSE
ncbi:hypothetical protein AAEY33_03960 [Peribacillus simplex]|uniref:hypothetical protein n=1 Tax=Peribacillus simplex TaxID=1478 RepID=UPI003264520A